MYLVMAATSFLICASQSSSFLQWSELWVKSIGFRYNLVDTNSHVFHKPDAVVAIPTAGKLEVMGIVCHVFETGEAVVVYKRVAIFVMVVHARSSVFGAACLPVVVCEKRETQSG